MGNRLKLLPASSSQCVYPCLPGPDPHDGTDIRHDDLTVPDTAGRRAARNGFDYVGASYPGRTFQASPGHKIGRILNPPLNFSIPFLASESFDFCDRHPMHTHFHLGILDFIQLERLDESLNNLHVDASLTGSLKDEDGTPSLGSPA